VLVLLASSGACLEPTYHGAFPQREDVAIVVPAGGATPRGEVYDLVTSSALAIDARLADVVGDLALVVEPLIDQRETSRDGGWLEFGPFDEGDLAFFVRVHEEDANTRFEVLVGSAGTSSIDAMDLLASGNIAIDGDERKGDVDIDVAALERHPEIGSGGGSGRIEAAFSRNVVSGMRQVDLRLVEVVGDTLVSNGDGVVRAEPDGAGAFVLVRDGELAGVRSDRIETSARWRNDASGRARAIVRALPDGDLVVDECFDATGMLTYRELTEAYAVLLPTYAFGDASTCVLAGEELHVMRARSAAQRRE
jgi:hypothetical protein